MKVAVVTPTIGAKTLRQCVESVEAQTYDDVTHYVFLDGEEEHGDKIWNQLQGTSKVKTIRLQENIGKGWYGHRVYAACSFLVNADVICYLDEDNFLMKITGLSLITLRNWLRSFRKEISGLIH